MNNCLLWLWISLITSTSGWRYHQNYSSHGYFSRLGLSPPAGR